MLSSANGQSGPAITTSRLHPLDPRFKPSAQESRPHRPDAVATSSDEIRDAVPEGVNINVFRTSRGLGSEAVSKPLEETPQDETQIPKTTVDQPTPVASIVASDAQHDSRLPSQALGSSDGGNGDGHTPDKAPAEDSGPTFEQELPILGKETETQEAGGTTRIAGAAEDS